MKRRDFMRMAALSGAILLPVSRHAWAASVPNTGATQKKLIVVMLRGAVDGLSVVAPYADAEYYRLRPRACYELNMSTVLLSMIKTNARRCIPTRVSAKRS